MIRFRYLGSYGHIFCSAICSIFSSEFRQCTKVQKYPLSPVSAVGKGYRGIIAPDLFYYGGHKLLKEKLDDNIDWAITSRNPGCKVTGHIMMQTIRDKHIVLHSCDLILMTEGKDYSLDGRQNSNWQAVRKGTLQHEIFMGENPIAWNNDELIIKVNCKEDAGKLHTEAILLLCFCNF